ncbi:DUF4388 domain-containing protein [Microbispora sp. NPDC049125]|uniref:DUF4388 domain-containing protein n=1 Tax=Microbispora sp. NPDC049125 TaxID=3154929 RepID=UPI003466A5C7
MAASTLDTALPALAADGTTGALRAGKEGTVYLSQGRVSYVECAATLSVEELLAASGRISATGLRTVRQAAGPDEHGGDILVRQGVLSRGELQFCVLGATLDAAYFLLQARPARTRFKEGEEHWLGAHWFFDVPGLLRECARRRSRLERAWPSAELDGRPVTPVSHIGAARAVLTPLQWELMRTADCTATPAELARRLGRPAYSTLLAVRELAAAGLLDTGQTAAPALPKRTPPGGRSQPGRGAGTGKEPASPPQAEGRHASGPLAVNADATDVNLLIRLRDALEAL